MSAARTVAAHALGKTTTRHGGSRSSAVRCKGAAQPRCAGSRKSDDYIYGSVWKPIYSSREKILHVTCQDSDLAESGRPVPKVWYS